ncbi:Macrolide export ATP-binding/permease protein MacB [Caulifigura coniformis]|uniref:Macrolide export ATP-binding/permease protein MacB n=1 Tax=Caulifigura coniformis TaxID=2527983 RepID=A0A517SJG0_9PLAN|nr:ABC transporter ATP-binding protein [Caulifigura coniformis]QDT56255.1 Macrolide export ATP-binding/permease protein MacB [Caulifigura coniformis]
MSSAVSIPEQREFASRNGSRPAVVVRHLTKAFGDGENRLLALKDINLEVQAGELTLLVGPSGCGKTTLISIVAGLLNPTEGHVEVLGEDLAEMSGTRLVNFRGEKIGFVFQQYNLLPSLTAAENAAIPLLIARRPRKEAVAEAKKVLDSVGLGNRVDAYPNTLSGGQQQRVAIARALVHNPHLLVCDEPTAALDAHSGRTVMGLLKQVALQSDRAVIVVTHDNRVFDFGDRIIHMADGEIERIETRDEMLARGGAH